MSKLKAEEWIRLELKSAELLIFMTEIKKYYDIHQEHGVLLGYNNFLFTEKNVKQLVDKLQSDNSLLEALLDESRGELIFDSINWLINNENSEQIIKKFQFIDSEGLEKLNTIIGLSNLKRLISIWKENNDNENEEFWQTLLKDNSWILSQIFASPLILLQDKAYIGGKGLGNKGGKVIDFIYKNKITNDVSLIEIKTPKTKLLSNEYRNNVYSIHPELTGAVVQVLSYKDKIQKEFNSLANESDEDFKVFNPICVVIAGSLDELNLKQIQSFELYRKEMNSVQIITFDEVINKIEMLYDLLNS